MRLQLTGISKSFPGVKALDRIQFELDRGEVHALCGENGAGKSTLMNMLAGNLQPDAGTITLNGAPVQITDPMHAATLGIAIVYQQLSLIDTLSVGENIFANTQPRNRWGVIDDAALNQRTRALLGQLKITGIESRTPVGELSPGQKQMVEIAKALAKEPDVLILDEPTASITEHETRVLFSLIRQLKAAGKSVIYISHRLREVFEIADRVTVFKDGRYQGTRRVSEVTDRELIRLMVGRDVEVPETVSHARTEELLRVEDLSGEGFRHVSFTLRRGEVLGLAGLVGAGRSQVAQTIFGYLPAQAGKMYLRGQELRPQHPADAIRRGIAYVPEERKSQGLFLDQSVADNVVVTNLKAASSGGGLDEAKAARIASDYQKKLRLVTPGVQQRVLNLSGGNQQKIVLAKWLLTEPDLLIVDEPTHGIDVGAKADIYKILKELTAEGKGILLISSELPELLALSDRILVLREGHISGEIAARGATEEQIMTLAAV